uniref:Phorbol-ester/DAG-type domain-containing protein n=1 Tax=Meloidogyne incognita TaxID=6306 RepID=A0A914KYH2_MELIC
MEKRRSQVLAKLVELKLELETHRESLIIGDNTTNIKRIKYHEFVMQSARGTNVYCEVCLSIIWRLIQYWRRCKVCGFRVHDKCIDQVQRQCVSTQIYKTDFSLSLQICPENSLRNQNFRCAECLANISFDEESDKIPRLCDYTGLFYCSRCHWNDSMVIPARLVRNWDANKRPVCRATKQLLVAIMNKPLIDLPKENPLLFKFVNNLSRIGRLRNDIMLMKCYFVSCKIAKKLRILQHLNRYQHFVETDIKYSLEDLIKIATGSGGLLKDIESIVEIFNRHITQECEICRGNAFFCELCSDEERIYPFSDNVAICKSCLAVYHRHCFDHASKRCTRCARRRARRKAIMMKTEEEGE